MKQKNRFSLGFILGFGASFVLFASIVIGIFIGHNNRLQTGSTFSDKVYEKTNEIKSKIDSNYLEKVDEKALEAGVYKGLMSGLGDKYSEYYTAEEFKELMADTEGDYKGIGVVVGCTKENRLLIAKVFDDSPAARAEIKAGDYITTVKGEEVSGKELEQVVSVLKKGEAVEIGIYRESTKQNLKVYVKAEKIDIQNVEYKMVDPVNKIGYINILQFSENAAEQTEEALNHLKAEGVHGIIFDVRNNPGGSLTSVTRILDRLLPNGVLMTSKDKNGKEIERVESDSNALGLPMAVLQNDQSASASELFAGAIQDFKAGKIIGTVSYGKGILQKVIKLDDGSALKITTEKYYTPSGRNIHGEGIKPDIEVENENSYIPLSMNDKQFNAAKNNIYEKLGMKAVNYSSSGNEAQTETIQKNIENKETQTKEKAAKKKSNEKKVKVKSQKKNKKKTKKKNKKNKKSKTK